MLNKTSRENTYVFLGLILLIILGEGCRTITYSQNEGW